MCSRTRGATRRCLLSPRGRPWPLCDRSMASAVTSTVSPGRRYQLEVAHERASDVDGQRGDDDRLDLTLSPHRRMILPGSARRDTTTLVIGGDSAIDACRVNGKRARGVWQHLRAPIETA